MSVVSQGGGIIGHGTVGVVAPSSPCDAERLKRGITALEALGFSVRCFGDLTSYYGRTITAEEIGRGILFGADSPENRAQALTEALVDDSIDGVIAARGAYGSHDILHLLDFDLIRARSRGKPCMGFSDMTTLLWPLSAHGGCAAIHGPMVSGAFADVIDSDGAFREGTPEGITVRRAMEVWSHAAERTRGREWGIAEGDPFAPDGFILRGTLRGTLREKKTSATGPLVGGSLTVLTSLIGTKFEPQWDGSILFIEDVGERPYRIHRMLVHLQDRGVFDRIAGVVLGTFDRCAHTTGPTVSDIFDAVFSKVPFPVTQGLQAGHSAYNLALPLGAMTTISEEGVTIRL